MGDAPFVSAPPVVETGQPEGGDSPNLSALMAQTNVDLHNLAIRMFSGLEVRAARNGLLFLFPFILLVDLVCIDDPSLQLLGMCVYGTGECRGPHHSS